jgi:transmembrane sensor
MNSSDTSPSSARPDDATLLLAAVERARGLAVTPDVGRSLDEWLAADTGLARDVDTLDLALTRAYDRSATSPEAVLAVANAIVCAPAAMKPPSIMASASVARSKKPPRGGPLFHRVRYAAVGLTLAILGIVSYRAVSWTSLTRRPAVQTTQLLEQRTKLGQRASVRLADGSTVFLNAGSRIQYAADFGRGSREVTLEGEALFTVAQQSGAPFVVRAGGVATRVLGTTFSVRHYHEDSTTTVVVAQGKVMVAHAVLTSGQAASSTASGAVSVVPSADVAQAMAWTTGELMVRYVPLRDAIPQLQRWYDVDIIADSTLANRAIRVTLHDETPRQAFDLIAEAIGARAQWRGRTVVLQSSTRTQ